MYAFFGPYVVDLRVLYEGVIINVEFAEFPKFDPESPRNEGYPYEPRQRLPAPCYDHLAIFW